MKAKIEAQEGFPTNTQRLARLLELLDDNRTLSDYGIDDESVLHLVDSLPSTPYLNFLQDTGTRQKIEFQPSTTILELKAKVELATGIERERICCSFKGLGL